MARGTAGQALNLVFLYEFSSELALVCGGPVAHLEDPFSRAYVHAGIAMAAETPGHCEILRLPHERHPIDTPMTRLAPDALVYVDAVIEIDKLRKIVNPRPFNRLAGSVTFAHRFQDRRHCPHLRMAVHANLSGRNIGKRTLFHCRVAVAAVNAQVSDMMLVTERNRLAAWNVLQGFVRGPDDHLSQPCDERNAQNNGQKGEPRDRIGGTREKLRHLPNRLRVLIPSRNFFRSLLVPYMNAVEPWKARVFRVLFKCCLDVD